MKKLFFVFVLVFLSFMMFGCGDNPENELPDQTKQQDSEPEENDNDEVQDDQNVNEDPDDGEQTLDESVFAQGSLDSSESKEHTLIIEEAGVYDIYTTATFDSIGVIYSSDGERIKKDSRVDDFLITVFLEPNTYKIEVSGYTQNEFGDYQLHVEYKEELAGVFYYVVDKVKVGGINEHQFKISVAGNYRIVGDSEINIVGTLYNGDNYVTNDYDSGLGFTIELYLEPGDYSINVNGFQWYAAEYEIFIYQD